MFDYETAVQDRNPSWYWDLHNPSVNVVTESDWVNGYRLRHDGTRATGGMGSYFNGQAYCVAGSGAQYGIGAGGVLTVMAWIKPDPPFLDTQSTGYVHWMGKGSADHGHEWAMRMYGATSTDDPPRPYRVSGYAFNKEGGLGVGAYFQDLYPDGFNWMHVVSVLNARTGWAKIYKNGELRNSQRLDKYGIKPTAGPAPLRIGTRDFGSYFKGSIAHVAGWKRELSVMEIQGLYSEMRATNG